MSTRRSIDRVLRFDVLPFSVLFGPAAWLVEALAVFSFTVLDKGVRVLPEGVVFLWWFLVAVAMAVTRGKAGRSGALAVPLVVFAVSWWPLLRPGGIPLRTDFLVFRMLSVVAAPLVVWWYRKQPAPETATPAQ